MASEYIVLFNGGQRTIFNEVVSAVIRAVRAGQSNAGHAPQFFLMDVSSWMLPKELERRL